jgi:hypothetical protein
LIYSTQFFKPPSLLWAFFALSYVFTWLFWVPRALGSQGAITLPVNPVVFQIAGAFGPCLAAICLT